MIAKTPKPPNYAVIFTSIRTDEDGAYHAMSAKMLELAKQQPGFLGAESARNEIGITVSYWESSEHIKAWKTNIDHLEAQKMGKEKWYESYKVRIAKVEREYGLRE